MTYLVPFNLLVQKLAPKGTDGRAKIAISYDEFKGIIKLLLRAVEIDEEWYRREYKDVAAALDANKVRSAKEHFIENGYFEGRLPRRLEIDETWYIRHHEDVAEGLHTGEFESALRHYEEHGYREGRLPAEY